MDVEDIAARLRERLELALRLLDHQVDVEREAGHLAHGLDDERAEGDGRHEVAVHHVEVEVVRARGLHGSHLLSQPAQVGGEE